MTDENKTVVTKEELLAQLQEALTKGDFKAVAKVSKDIALMQAAEEKSEKDKKLEALKTVTLEVKKAIDKVVEEFYASGKLDEADGVFYTNNFEENLQTCRLLKNAPKSSGGTHEGKGKKFPSTSELLKEHGEEIADEEGNTWNTLYEQAKGDGNKVYQIRIKLGKKLGYI